MFRNRRKSQKPADELYASFKQHFPEVGPGTASSSAAPSESTNSLSDALTDAAMNQRQFDETDDVKDLDPTPRGSNEPWRFTPSLLDPGSFNFAAFANQPSGYYTPTPGGTNTLYHSQAGDLHAPGMGIHLGTPLSLPAADGSMHAVPSIDMHAFHPHLLQAHTFQHSNPFAAPQETFAPASFIHQDSGYDAMDASADGSPDNEVIMESDLQKESRVMEFSSRQFDGSMPAPPIPSTEKFRFHVTLNATTAMIRHADEIPVTYLNKGQAYSISIVDTMPLVPSPGPVKYRTFIRISFEDEQQRLRPSTCWQLWKEGRGLAEAHQRGGKLQAVEYVDPNQGGDEETRRAGVELESASFDGFSVTWTPNATARADCSVAVRFNFLSTDFSHSKGVKGIPVRLCAKTEIISSGTPDTPPVAGPEVCFCKVKLFRDHGAERKLSNDVAHVKKTIEKLKQQITQAESGLNDFGKRKRSGSMATKGRSSRPGKVQKHKRTWSMSSQGSTGGRPMAEEDLHLKLATMSEMFNSCRPVSILYLRGYEQDDPDLFPVSLPGEPQDLTKDQAINRQTSWDRRPSGETTPTNSCLVSPSPSSRSLQSQPPPHDRSDFKKPKPVDLAQIVPSDWINFSHVSDADFPLSNPQGLPAAAASQPVKVEKGQADSSLPEWIEALGVDSAYRPPPERPVKPVACFYVLIKVVCQTAEDDYYRAVYLMQRTVKDLISSIASKCQVDPTRVVRTFRVNAKGLKIIVDDEVVRELPEGQDMTVEFFESGSDRPVKQEKDTAKLDVSADHDTTAKDAGASTALEMKLLF